MRIVAMIVFLFLMFSPGNKKILLCCSVYHIPHSRSTGFINLESFVDVFLVCARRHAGDFLESGIE